jgi:hypothetical protein
MLVAMASAPNQQGPARRHHLVSKFYLRHFADADDQITTVLLPGDRTFVQNIANASVQNNFYTAVGVDGDETDAAERAFSVIETPAAEAWQYIAAGVWPLPSIHREAVAGWIALHLLRGSGNRAQMHDIGNDLLQLNIIAGGRARLREVLREEGEPYDDESVTREWIALFEDPPRVEVHPNEHLSHIAHMLPRVTRSLLDRWWLLTSFRHKSLATSDHPVHVVPNQRDLDLRMGTGIENADLIHVPVTRRHSLALGLRSTLPPILAGSAHDRHQAGVAATALYSNSCTVNSARQAIFHHPHDRPLAGLTLPSPRRREVGDAGDPWRFMPDEDRQVLLDAGLQPPSDH